MGRSKIEKASDPRGALVRLLGYLRPFTPTLVLVLILILVSSALGLVGPYLLGVAIDSFRDSAELLRIILIMLAVYLGGWLTQVVYGYITATVAQKALRALRRDLFEHLQVLSLSFFDRQPQGELMSRLTNDIDAINQALSQSAAELVTSLLSLGGILIAMFALNAWLALATLAVFPLMVILTLLIAKRTRKHYRKLQQNLGQLNSLMEETLSGQRVVLAFTQEEATIADFEKANVAVRDAGIQAMVYPLLIPPLMGVLSSAGIAVVAGLGGWLAIQGLATVGTIATFITYSRRFAQPLRHLGQLYNSIQAALAGAERVFEVIDEKPELTDTLDALPLEDIAGEVIFDHVGFSYLPGVPVLKDVSLRAEPGQTIALVGPTGAGKTTMVNLLTRFYDIQDGSICIDGRDIREVQKKSLRRRLGLVLQDTFLFADTVMENIRYGRLSATDEECVAAAKLANADQFIQRLPQSYQTMLSERGSNLSQGQSQLLTIARAILTDPGILILDEATSSVDTRTEVRIQEALLRLMEDRTSFVIAHRLSTIRKADQVLVINSGRIIERGTHQELLALGGFYHNLYMSQFKGKAA
ncbi:MAG: ABC transporter ATP-binding protein/permease [Anaerolineae bacterium]|nr:ABC transporter ATP-binding protein/permease [Anaerolineae bacterium]